LTPLPARLANPLTRPVERTLLPPASLLQESLWNSTCVSELDLASPRLALQTGQDRQDKAPRPS